MNGHDSQTIDELRRQNEQLAEQVKWLVQAERELYAIQEDLDGQMRVYRKLYEVGKQFNATFKLEEVLRLAVQFVLYELNFERCVVLVRSDAPAEYRVGALDGYYDEEPRASVEQLVVPVDHPGLARLKSGSADYVLCAPSGDQPALTELGRRLGLDEYLLFPLTGGRGEPSALLVAGNTLTAAPVQARVSAESEVLLGVANLAGQLGIAISNAQFYAALEREHQRLKRQVQELRIQVDQGKKERAVAEISTTDYFRNLQAQAEQLRLRARG